MTAGMRTMKILWLSLITVYLCSCYAAPTLRGTDGSQANLVGKTSTVGLRVHSERPKENTPRSASKKHNAKPKMHYTASHLAHTETKYGVDLPSFAFDFSEYFSGAIIERGYHTKDLYLTMFLVGHKSISMDFPFEAISTDEEVLHAWSQAVKKWGGPSHLAPSSSSSSGGGSGGGSAGGLSPKQQLQHKSKSNANAAANEKSSPTRLLAASSSKITEPGAPTKSSSSSSSIHSSGLSCILQNNDGHNSQVYQVNAYWVHANTSSDRKDGSSYHGNFAILRCKLRNHGAPHIYQNATYNTRKELFVDVMRTNPHLGRKHVLSNGIPGVSTGNNTSTVTTSTTGGAIIAADPRGTVLSSFSVPWSARVVGYPLQPHANASALNPWMVSGVSTKYTPNSIQEKSEHGAKLSTFPSSQTAQQLQAQSLPPPPLPHIPSTSTYLCVTGLRPLHPLRAQVGLPALLEFIEHHLLLGFQHILLGMALDW